MEKYQFLIYYWADFMMNALETLNRTWFYSLNAKPGMPDWLMAFATFSAQYTLYIIPLILLAHWFRGGKAGHEKALFSLVTILVALALGFICTTLYFHPRPFMVPLGHTWIYHVPDNSFPSDHATLFFSAGMSLLFARAWKTGSLVLFVSLFVAWSRVFLGIHFPLDMVGAAIMAVLACILVRPLWKLWGDSLTLLCEFISTKLFFWLPAPLTP